MPTKTNEKYSTIRINVHLEGEGEFGMISNEINLSSSISPAHEYVRMNSRRISTVTCLNEHERFT